MTNLQKFYKLALNMLENHADLEFTWDYEKEDYGLMSLKMQISWWEIYLGLGMEPLITKVYLQNTNDERHYLAVVPDDMDKIINGLEDSYLDFLLEGIKNG